MSSRNEIAERRSLVRTLHGLGWGGPEIARPLGVRHKTVYDDLRRLGVNSARRPKIVPLRYQRSLVRYLRLERTSSVRTPNRLQTALESLLGFERLKTFLRGCLETYAQFLDPPVPDQCRPYKRLLDAAAGWQGEVESVERGWETVLGDLALRGTGGLPRSEEEFRQFLQEYCWQSYHHLVRLPWPPDSTKHVEQLLRSIPIPERSGEVLRLRYGLTDGRERTYAEVGQAIGISGSQAHVIAASAHYRLLAKWRRARVAHLVDPAEQAIGTIQRENDRLRAQITATWAPSDDDKRAALRRLLAIPLDEFDLSVRSSNMLKMANIKTVGDLLQRTEAGLLKYMNFGRKSLLELAQLVESLGLSFGMEPPSESETQTLPRSS